MEDRLHFGGRARRKAKRRRRQRVAAFVSIAAIGVGIPGADAGLRVLERLTGENDADHVSAGGYEATESATSALKFRRKVFAARPTPSPENSPVGDAAASPVYSGSVTEIIAAAAAEFGLSPDYLVAVAHCESTLNPGAVNAAGYHGLFQFDQQTWAAYGYGSIYDPVAQARTAARLIAAGQASRWPSCA